MLGKSGAQIPKCSWKIGLKNEETILRRWVGEEVALPPAGFSVCCILEPALQKQVCSTPRKSCIQHFLRSLKSQTNKPNVSWPYILLRQHSLLLRLRLPLDFPKALYNHCVHFWTSKSPFSPLHCVFCLCYAFEIIVADLINDIFIHNPNGSFSVLHHWTSERLLTKWIAIIFLLLSPSLPFVLGKDGWRGTESFKTKTMYVKIPRHKGSDSRN